MRKLLLAAVMSLAVATPAHAERMSIKDEMLYDYAFNFGYLSAHCYSFLSGFIPADQFSVSAKDMYRGVSKGTWTKIYSAFSEVSNNVPDLVKCKELMPK